MVREMADSSSLAETASEPGGALGGRPRHRRRWIAAGVLAAVAAVGTAAGIIDGHGGGGTGSTGAAGGGSGGPQNPFNVFQQVFPPSPGNASAIELW